jgi:hypothetical protein
MCAAGWLPVDHTIRDDLLVVSGVENVLFHPLQQPAEEACTHLKNRNDKVVVGSGHRAVRIDSRFAVFSSKTFFLKKNQYTEEELIG